MDSILELMEFQENIIPMNLCAGNEMKLAWM